jgi:hypothetical protein
MDEGYDIDIRDGHLLIKSVPYVNSRKEIVYGTLISQLSLAGDVTTTPNTHVVYFVGEHPCNKDGTEIAQIKHASGRQVLDRDLVVDHSFSNKPANGFPNYYDKMTMYIAILSHPAIAIDPSVTAQTFPVLEDKEQESIFNYVDTASSRAGISAISRKLELGKVAIVGLGGTGSFVLDLVAKTPVRELHLFDGDRFSQHNAFRSPGAPSVDDLRQKQQKVTFFKKHYSKMRRHIIPHDCYIGASNVDQLHGMDFVFLCLDRGVAKKTIITKLQEWGCPFIDVGMGVQQSDGSLGGILRVTTSSVEKHGHLQNRISFSDGDDNNDYSQNIQTADLNALNAALAVIKYKKLFGFYRDLGSEHHCTYTIDTNMLLSEDES